MSPRAPAASQTRTTTTSRQDDRDSSNENNNEEQPLQATEAMCHHCFDTLLTELHKACSSSKSSSKLLLHKQSSTIPLEEELNDSKPDFTKSLPSLSVECPLFVTWDKRKHHHNHHHNHRRHSQRHNNINHKQQQQTDHQFELRGCIGTLSPKPVVTALGEYALLAALRDRRFGPVDLKEVSQLRVGVSLLVNYEECEHCHDWTVGVHGIIIRWHDPHRGSEYSATYLPEVAKEQGWNQQAAVKSLIRKAGWHGAVNEKLLRSVQCTRYQSSKFKLTYDDFVAQRGMDPVQRLLSDEDAEMMDHHNAKHEGGSGCCVM